MIVVLKGSATDEDIQEITGRLEELGYRYNVSRGEYRTIVGVMGALDEEKQQVAEQLEGLHYVERIHFILKPYKLVSSEWRAERSTVDVGGCVFGGRTLQVIAGPCSVESREQIVLAAQAVKQAGARLLRGGAFKPRTSLYTFQGLGYEGLDLLVEARKITGLPVVTEARSARDVGPIAEKADVVQIGARNMHNYDLLMEAGMTGKPVLLKRGLAATVDEWLNAAEYVAAQGNLNIILCERGIRTFETATRFTLDLSSIPVVQKLSHLPVIVDPSHGTGRRDLVPALARAAVAVGADGLMIEVHPQPERALSDGYQSLSTGEFEALMGELRSIAAAMGREI